MAKYGTLTPNKDGFSGTFSSLKAGRFNVELIPANVDEETGEILQKESDNHPDFTINMSRDGVTVEDAGAAWKKRTRGPDSVNYLSIELDEPELFDKRFSLNAWPADDGSGKFEMRANAPRRTNGGA